MVKISGWLDVLSPKYGDRKEQASSEGRGAWLYVREVPFVADISEWAENL